MKLKKVGIFFKKIPWVFGENTFFSILFLFLITLILGGSVFYKYIILTKRIAPEVKEKPLQFEEKIYEDILEIWQNRETKFNEADLKEYSNPFQKLTK